MFETWNLKQPASMMSWCWACLVEYPFGPLCFKMIWQPGPSAILVTTLKHGNALQLLVVRRGVQEQVDVVSQWGVGSTHQWGDLVLVVVEWFCHSLPKGLYTSKKNWVILWYRVRIYGYPILLWLPHTTRSLDWEPHQVMPGTAHRAHGNSGDNDLNILRVLGILQNIILIYISWYQHRPPNSASKSSKSNGTQNNIAFFSCWADDSDVYEKVRLSVQNWSVQEVRDKTIPTPTNVPTPRHTETTSETKLILYYHIIPLKISLPKCKNIIKISKTRLRTMEEVFTSLLSVIGDTTKEPTRTSLSGGLLGHISTSPYLSFVHTHFWFQGCFALLWLKYFGVPHRLRNFHTLPQYGPLFFFSNN